MNPRARRALKAAPYLVCVALYLGTLADAFDWETGFTHLILFGEKTEDGRLPAVLAVPHDVWENSWGYDGQWYAQLAVEPDVSNPDLQRALDAPAYRARRILLSWSAHVLGLGQPFWVLQAYALQNAVCWLAIAWLLLRWFPAGDVRSFALWFACLFSEGLLVSTHRALFGGPSILLFLVAMIALERGRTFTSAAILGVSGLARETNLLSAAIVAWPDGWSRKEVARRVGACALVALPLLLWLLYLRSVFVEGLSLGDRNFLAPFAGWAWKLGWLLEELGRDGARRHEVLSLLALVGLTVQWVFLAVRFDPRDPWWRLGAAYAVLAAFLGQAVWEGYPGSVTRVLVPMSFSFNVLLRGSRWFWPLLVLGNLGVVYGLDGPSE